MRVVEIKCPYNCRKADPVAAIKNKTIDYVHVYQGGFKLSNSHNRGYYDQVQMQMGLSGTRQADFVVWTKLDFVVVPVNYDAVFWESKCLPALVNFYEKYVVAELLTSRIKRGLHLFSDEKLENVKSQDEIENCIKPSSSLSCVFDSVDGKEDSDDDLDAVEQETCSVSSDTDKNNDGNVIDDDDNYNDESDWTLGCASYCRNDRAPQFSRVRDQMIACDLNINCGPNTWYHLFCEGFRRLPDNDSKYVCKKCRKDHPKCKILEDTNGFLF